MSDDDPILLDDMSDDALADLAARDLSELGFDGSAHGRVLLADDDQRIAAYVGRLLESLGLEVTWAASPADAERALRSGRFAFVLVDFMTDRRLGFQALARLRALDPATPIVLFTEDRVASEVACAEGRLRLSGWLPKPFDLASDLAPMLVRLGVDGARGDRGREGDLTEDAGRDPAGKGEVPEG